MLNEQTINQLTEMKLRSMAKAFREQMQDSAAVSSLSFEDRFGLIVDRQWSDRKNNNISKLTKSATFKFPYASIEHIRYDDDRNLDRKLIERLASGQYIKNKNNIIVTGASGAGKTYMGCAFGVAACRQLYKVKYIRLPELLEDLNIARGEGLYKKTVANYRKYRVLIFDEWMLTPLSEIQTADLFEIIESRYDENSTIFIAQSASQGWYQMIGESRIADAILDRIVYNSHEIFIDGKVSMRDKLGLKANE